MSATDPLEASLLDLHALLGEHMPLILGGGYGLYLKQNTLSRNATRTRFAEDRLPATARRRTSTSSSAPRSWSMPTG